MSWDVGREKEGESKRRAGAEAEGKKESQADSLLSEEPYPGLDLRTLKSQPEPKPRDGPLTK